jgi:hypothetical protein
MSQRLSRVVLLFCALAAPAAHAFAQGVTSSGGASGAAPAASAASAAGDPQLSEVLRLLREQREELTQLRAKLEEQTRVVEELRARVGRDEQLAASAPRPAAFAGALYSKGDGAQQTGTQQNDKPLEERVAGVEAQAKKTSEALSKQLGSISFSGDFRLRYESIYGQLNALPNSANPAIFGNELSPRQRFRIRARLAVRGQISKEFEWGLRFATGNTPDVISTNATLTDFFSRKSFALDQVYVTYKPTRLAGFQAQAGKFDVPWLRTEMTIDNDLTVEGFNESYSRDFKKSALKNLTFVAWQLPMLERASAFVLGADGKVDLEQSRRAGRDLALYGAQLRARFEPTKTVGLTLSADDLFYSGTQFITPAQVFGPNLQVPVTVTIPATATTPAQIVTGFATIPRDQLVSGNANLGVSVANNNATNRDGRLSSGFNLVNLIGRFDYTRSKRWPVMVLVNFVKNTQAHDVVLAGPGGTNRVLPNHEDQGWWAEFQVGRTQQRGESLFNYTFIRIEKDAVLTPFNHSDILQQSDVRVHRFNLAYALDPRVTLSLTGFVNQRPNGLLGPFGTTPAGSLNRPTTRLQLDTIFRF